MPHISHQELDSNLLEKIFDKLLLLLEKPANRKQLSNILNELLTDTEKIMLSKRLSVLLMLNTGTPQHLVVDMLRVSPSTVSKTALNIDIGKYTEILRIYKSENNSLEKSIWSMLTAGGIMPPKLGGKYWKKFTDKYPLLLLHQIKFTTIYRSKFLDKNLCDIMVEILNL